MTASDPSPQPGSTRSANDPLDPANLKSALKSFKKRLKLARLDDESRLGHGPMSSGGRSGIVAIAAPSQFPQSVWDELTRQGKIRRAGGGLYELASE